MKPSLKHECIHFYKSNFAVIASSFSQGGTSVHKFILLLGQSLKLRLKLSSTLLFHFSGAIAHFLLFGIVNKLRWNLTPFLKKNLHHKLLIIQFQKLLNYSVKKHPAVETACSSNMPHLII